MCDVSSTMSQKSVTAERISPQPTYIIISRQRMKPTSCMIRIPSGGETDKPSVNLKCNYDRFPGTSMKQAHKKFLEDGGFLISHQWKTYRRWIKAFHEFMWIIIILGSRRGCSLQDCGHYKGTELINETPQRIENIVYSLLHILRSIVYL